MFGRRLDRGNPTAGNIGSDFNRLGMGFWADVIALSVQNQRRRDALEEMNLWRNAIAHQDFDPSKLGGGVTLRLRQVRSWRGACNQLARAFDTVTKTWLQTRLGAAPW